MMPLMLARAGMPTQMAPKPCMTARIAYRKHLEREVPE